MISDVKVKSSSYFTFLASPWLSQSTNHVEEMMAWWSVYLADAVGWWWLWFRALRGWDEYEKVQAGEKYEVTDKICDASSVVVIYYERMNATGWLLSTLTKVIKNMSSYLYYDMKWSVKSKV